jgi:hypothetical protein
MPEHSVIRPSSIRSRITDPTGLSRSQTSVKLPHSHIISLVEPDLTTDPRIRPKASRLATGSIFGVSSRPRHFLWDGILGSSAKRRNSAADLLQI